MRSCLGVRNYWAVNFWTLVTPHHPFYKNGNDTNDTSGERRQPSADSVSANSHECMRHCSIHSVSVTVSPVSQVRTLRPQGLQQRRQADRV